MNWKNIQEEVPSQGKIVLCSTGDIAFIGTRLHGAPNNPKWIIYSRIKRVHSGKYWGSDQGTTESVNVTHWAEIPRPM